MAFPRARSRCATQPCPASSSPLRRGLGLKFGFAPKAFLVYPEKRNSGRPPRHSPPPPPPSPPTPPPTQARKRAKHRNAQRSLPRGNLRPSRRPTPSPFSLQCFQSCQQRLRCLRCVVNFGVGFGWARKEEEGEGEGEEEGRKTAEIQAIPCQNRLRYSLAG